MLAISVQSQEIFNVVKEGDITKLKLLIEKDPLQVNAVDNLKQTPLHIASQVGKIEVASCLISKGADLNAKDTRNWTPLTNSIFNNKTEIARLLLEKGANPNTFGMWNISPISLAAEFGREEITNFLIEKGAEIDVKLGRTSYMLISAACSKGSYRLPMEG